MKGVRGMKSFAEDGGACQREWHRARRRNLLKLTGELPQNLCLDEITLTISCRYAESLLKNPRVTKYLLKQHPAELQGLQNLLSQFEEACRVEYGPGLICRK
jgi:hypothetical protein